MKKTVACLLLCVIMVSSFAACARRGGPENTPTVKTGAKTETNTGTTLPEGEDFTPVIRFLVASDVHFDETPTIRDEKFRKMFENAYAYCDAHENYNKLDGAFFSGDIANHGTALEFERFFTALNDYAREGTVTRAVLGNHEFFTDSAHTVDRFLTASGYEEADDRLVVNGYHFIFLCPDQNGNGYTSKKQAYLASQLTIATQDDPTGKKPVFVFHHHHVRNTVYGSVNTWGVDDLYPVLSMCPQVVDFSGHSHFPINDPRSVWQGTFTAFNTASLKGLEMDMIGVKNEMVYPIDARGGWSGDFSNVTRSDGGQYYIVEVDAQNRLLVKPFDIMSGMAATEPMLLSVGDTSAFVYTDDRARTETPPAFAADAAVTPIWISTSAAVFRFPRTGSKTYVQSYRCEVYENGLLLTTVYRLDDGFLFPAPDYLDLPIEGLTANVSYHVRIIPVSAFGNEGEPLIFTFTTPAVNSVLTPEESLFFSAEFLPDNVAKNGMTGDVLTVAGTPRTEFDPQLGRYVGVFDGHSAYEYHDMRTYLPLVRETFTFETYVRMDERPETGYVNHFSDMENGGFGYEYKADGRMVFGLHVGGSYKTVRIASFETGTWAHMAVTYDGQVLTFYLNGVAVDQLTYGGEFQDPASAILVIGGDASGNGSNSYATCAVACANVYHSALTAHQVAALYAPWR